MIVLSRQLHECVQIGDQLTITVGAIVGDHVTFKFECETEAASMQSEFALASGASVALQGDVTLFLLEIRGDKVRIGIRSPQELSIGRKEAAATSQMQRPGVERTTVVLQVDQILRIGEKLTASPTDIDATGVRLLVKGELLGGPNDGERISEAKELGPNSVVTLGALISLSLVGADENGRAMFHVIAPANVKVSVQ